MLSIVSQTLRFSRCATIHFPTKYQFSCCGGFTQSTSFNITTLSRGPTRDPAPLRQRSQDTRTTFENYGDLLKQSHPFKNLMQRKRTCTLRFVQTRFESGKNLPLSPIFEYSHDAVFKFCRLEFHFQNILLSKSAGKKCAIFM